MMSRSESNTDHELVDSDQSGSDVNLQDESRKRARTHDEKSDDVIVLTKKVAQLAPATGGQLSMMHFIKDNEQLGKQVADTQKVQKRDYTKYKQVCLVCAKNSKLKDKSLSVISRGGPHQIKRHHSRNHPSLSLSDMKRQIVPLEHVSVPKGIRALVSKKSKSKKQENKSISSASSVGRMMMLDHEDPAPSISTQTQDPKQKRSVSHLSSLNETSTGT